MKNSTKYMVAGSIIAGVGSVYAVQRNIDSDVMYDFIERNTEKFKDIIEELISLSMELLEKMMNFIKKLFIELSYKLRLALNI